MSFPHMDSIKIRMRRTKDSETNVINGYGLETFLTVLQKKKTLQTRSFRVLKGVRATHAIRDEIHFFI